MRRNNVKFPVISRRNHISCNSPGHCILIVHSTMSRVIRKLRLPDYVVRRDLRSLPRNLIDTDTSENLKCVHVRMQPPLLLSSIFPGDRENCLSSLNLIFYLNHYLTHFCFAKTWKNRFQNFEVRFASWG